MNKNFIRTTDETVKDELVAEGYQLVSSDNNGWTFLNDMKKPKTFSAKDKVAYTNILSV